MVLGLTPDDLDKLNLDNIDIIAALGKWKEWSNDQVRSVCCTFKLFTSFAHGIFGAYSTVESCHIKYLR